MIFQIFKIFQISEMAPVNLEDMFTENKTLVEGFVGPGFEKVAFLIWFKSSNPDNSSTMSKA